MEERLKVILSSLIIFPFLILRDATILRRTPTAFSFSISVWIFPALPNEDSARRFFSICRIETLFCPLLQACMGFRGTFFSSKGQKHNTVSLVGYSFFDQLTSHLQVAIVISPALAIINTGEVSLVILFFMHIFGSISKVSLLKSHTNAAQQTLSLC